ncbi:tRNA lysidine(34) synthetase TilS [Allofrancisella guangzhouensis]|uniref:tRNA(Ile)-lysidine synthase n=1 Tax=Allofrancisella guangzhouensis TaxID=594679 RepID=A0A0A8E5U9_9GAMM|nr:tRNA lysidine(34) synthetase TilS [Allofrancisella guangzhouensis]AJC48977.1 tRNA(Ile)-lysidine synthetase [Allofrancisella guangzhouensis]MBK2027882.1 tRNA lysidine(34) synthetase TilS [Allofrancisella guangzhouensis]MBK2044135.1 tRNA lysidine(34) synthetase TilS [Allofrancisella guangzhouensis]MBK2045115.1 tRNA lysidine(34) synthetase TilS [Allofrancisella guangzhouensis]
MTAINKAKIIKEITSLRPSHIIIGYSGGVDSSVLLNISTEINIPIVAIYINHSIHPQADNWQTHCQQICQLYKVEFITHTLGKAPKSESFEAWASKQRMIFFQKIMSNYPNPLLLLGHHLDDQAETFLLQAIRGAGLAGLSGMPHYKKLKNGALLRPLLNYPKAEIEKFATDNNIIHIYDDSNQDNKYRRNLIRNQIIPILKEFNPSISKTLSRSANICAQSNNLLHKLLAEKLTKISDNKHINLDLLIKLDRDIQTNLLHLWFKNNTHLSLKANQLDTIILSLNSNQVTTGWQLDINYDYTLVVEYGLLKIKQNALEELSIDKQTIINWLEQHFAEKKDFSKVVIRDRKSSDKCKYPGRQKHNGLKILFQELKIPANDRHKAKVIILDDKIIAVYPFFICGYKT